jgi:hypothetical protein
VVRVGGTRTLSKSKVVTMAMGVATSVVTIATRSRVKKSSDGWLNEHDCDGVSWGVAERPRDNVAVKASSKSIVRTLGNHQNRFPLDRERRYLSLCVALALWRIPKRHIPCPSEPFTPRLF